MSIPTKNLLSLPTLRTFSLLIIIPIFCLILTVIAFRATLKWEQQEIEAGFQLAAEDRFSALEREIESNLEALLALKAFYTASQRITRSQFRDFVAPLLSHHPSIQALEWIPLVTDSQRDVYEAEAKRDGFSDFEISERGAQEKMVRANKRKEYFPVYFLEPYKSNETALGFDLASNPTRLEALKLSREKGEMVATGRVTLVQEVGNQFGFLVFLPVYRTDSIHERPENLEGFVLGVFRISDVFEKSLSYLKPVGVNVYLYDKGATEKERFLYFHESGRKTTALPVRSERTDEYKPSKPTEYIKILDFANRKWELRYVPTPDYIAARKIWQPWGALFGGLLLTGILATYLWVSFNRSKRIEQLVIDRTKELQKTNEMLAKEIAVRTQTEEALRQERDKAQKYLDVAGAIIIVIEANQRVSLINRKGCEVLGYNEEEIIGANWFETFLPESSRDRVKGVFTMLMSGEADPLEYFENPVISKSGEEKIIAWRNSLLRDEAGKIIGILSSGEDITERKRAEEALRKKEERFRDLYDSAPVGYHEYDTEGRITNVNRTDLEMLGYSREEMIGHYIWKFNVEEDIARQQILEKLAGLRPPGRSLERNYRRKDGITIPVLIEDRLTKDEQGRITGIRCIIQDITKRKQMEEVLRKREEEAQRLAEENAILAEIGRIISSAPNIEEVYELFSSKVRMLLPYDRIAINLINKDGTALINRYVEGGFCSRKECRRSLSHSGNIN